MNANDPRRLPAERRATPTGDEPHELEQDVIVAQMVVAADLVGLLPLAKDDSLDTDEWWRLCEPIWGSDAGYLANLRTKEDEHGRQWVREHMADIHGYWKNSLQLAHVQAFAVEHGSLDRF